MPDPLGFDHIRSNGAVYHRCIECEWPGYGQTLSEGERARHHATHTKAHQREAEKARLAALARARKALNEKRRVNEIAYRKEGDA